jgi:hypothetical protein
MKIINTLMLGAGLALAGAAVAALPPPSPAQAQAAAAKKAEADAKAEQEKQRLAARMDAVSARWRQRAASEGYKIKPPVVVASGTGAAVNQASAASATKENIAAGMTVGTPAFVATPPGAGIQAPPPANAARGTSGAAPAPAAAPLSPQALNSANVPVKSEKHGTARPSEDVKRAPSRSLPAGAAPTVNKEGVPSNAGKQ